MTTISWTNLHFIMFDYSISLKVSENTVNIMNMLCWNKSKHYRTLFLQGHILHRSGKSSTISAILTIAICDKCDSVVKSCNLTSEECDFMIHKIPTSITNFPGAVTYIFVTCDECDPTSPRWELYDLVRIRSYKASWVG